MFEPEVAGDNTTAGEGVVVTRTKSMTVCDLRRTISDHGSARGPTNSFIQFMSQQYTVQIEKKVMSGKKATTKKPGKAWVPNGGSRKSTSTVSKKSQSQVKPILGSKRATSCSNSKSKSQSKPLPKTQTRASSNPTPPPSRLAKEETPPVTYNQLKSQVKSLTSFWNEILTKREVAAQVEEIRPKLIENAEGYETELKGLKTEVAGGEVAEEHTIQPSKMKLLRKDNSNFVSMEEVIQLHRGLTDELKFAFGQDLSSASNKKTSSARPYLICRKNMRAGKKRLIQNTKKTPKSTKSLINFIRKNKYEMAETQIFPLKLHKHKMLSVLRNYLYDKLKRRKSNRLLSVLEKMDKPLTGKIKSKRISALFIFVLKRPKNGCVEEKTTQTFENDPNQKVTAELLPNGLRLLVTLDTSTIFLFCAFVATSVYLFVVK